jgi:hypothetical protein
MNWARKRDRESRNEETEGQRKIIIKVEKRHFQPETFCQTALKVTL